MSLEAELFAKARTLPLPPPFEWMEIDGVPRVGFVAQCRTRVTLPDGFIAPLMFEADLFLFKDIKFTVKLDGVEEIETVVTRAVEVAVFMPICLVRFLIECIVEKF